MEYAVGMAELRSIAKGIEATDAVLKTSEVKIIAAQSSCPGKYELVFSGRIASVQTALDHINAVFSADIIDSVKMGRIDQSVIKALLGAETVTQKGAVAVIETFSASSAVLAADAAVKAAKIEILELRTSRGLGGKGYVIITGEVGDVTAAAEAASSYAKEQGLLSGVSVIAAPHEELWNHI